jgi:hypothetical protein
MVEPVYQILTQLVFSVRPYPIIGWVFRRLLLLGPNYLKISITSSGAHEYSVLRVFSTKIIFHALYAQIYIDGDVTTALPPPLFSQSEGALFSQSEGALESGIFYSRA